MIGKLSCKIKIRILLEKYLLMENTYAVWKNICILKVYFMFPKIYSNWKIIIILHVYTSSFKRRYANRKYSRCWQKYMTIEKICVVSTYWKSLATWPIQPRGSVKVFVLAMWYVCMRLLNIFPAVNTNSSRGEVLKFVNKGRF